MTSKITIVSFIYINTHLLKVVEWLVCWWIDRLVGWLVGWLVRKCLFQHWLMLLHGIQSTWFTYTSPVNPQASDYFLTWTNRNAVISVEKRRYFNKQTNKPTIFCFLIFNFIYSNSASTIENVFVTLLMIWQVWLLLQKQKNSVLT